jgi:hypothetical protein
MRRLLALALVLLAGCGGTTISTSLPVITAPGQTAGAATTAPAATTGAAGTPATGVTIPAACAAGFTDFLKQIEPVVAGFDLETATLGEFFTVDDLAKEKGVDIMMANGAAATYSCPEVGLEFAYFDSNSPWLAIHELATAQAPGTEPWLQVTEKLAQIDGAKLADFGAATCEDGSKRIKDAVAGQMGAGTHTAADMAIGPGLELLGLYRAYLAAVREGTCPDVLGNDEFDFFGAIG